jgi:hypothetical protein
VRKSDTVLTLSATTGALGAVAAAILAAPTAYADPAIPPPPPPAPGPLLPAPPPPPAEQSIATQAAGEPVPAATPAERPHLSSPENPPPGTTDDPVGPRESPGISYLRDLWHAVQTQEISGRDALLLLTQRPLDPNAVPFNGLPPGPQAPAPAPAPEGAPPAPGQPAPFASASAPGEPAPAAAPAPLAPLPLAPAGPAVPPPPAP